MNYIFKGEIINYNFLNHTDETVVFLHGWGGDKNSFLKTIKLLQKNYNILTVTIPTINPTNVVWDMFDFRDLIINLFLQYNIKNPIIICHSFGFRIATLLKDKIPIKKIIVTGGAGMKKNNIFKKAILNQKILYNIMSKLKKFKNFSKQNDYHNLSKINQQTFKNIVNFNTKKLIKFTCPMLLFWGKFDNETPLWIGKVLYKKNNAKFIVVNSNHFAYLNESSYFNNQILGFLS